MNAKHLLTMITLAMAPVVASAGIVIEKSKDAGILPADSLIVQSTPMIDFQARRAAPAHQVVPVTTLPATLDGPTDEARRYLVGFSTKSHPAEFFLAPGEDVKVLLTADGIVVEGSPLNNAVDSLRRALLVPYIRLVDEARMMPNPDDMAISRAGEAMCEAFRNYAMANVDSPAAVYALQYGGEEAADLLPKLGTGAVKSVMEPLYLNMLERAERMRQREAALGQIRPGNPAPEFTLPDLEGRQVSLSSLRGRWMILDFWGTWCPWCIKGFPKLKEVHEQFGDKLAIIGIDCNDDEAAWRAGVKRYALPWLQLYAGESESPAMRAITTAYAIQGFPTKLLLNPEGRIVKVAIGEDPSFFQGLDSLIK